MIGASGRPTKCMMTTSLRTSGLLSAILIIGLTGAAAEDKASTRARAAGGNVSPFLGKWNLDKKKTQTKGGPEDLQCEIKQDGSGIVVKSKYQEPQNAVYPLLWVGVM